MRDTVNLPESATDAQREALRAVIDAQAPRQAQLTGWHLEGTALRVAIKVTPTHEDERRTLPYWLEVRLGAKGATRVIEDNSPEERQRQQEIARERRERQAQAGARDPWVRDSRGNLVGLKLGPS